MDKEIVFEWYECVHWLDVFFLCNTQVALDALVPVVFNQADIVHMISISTADFLTMESRSDSRKAEVFDKEYLKAKMRQSHMGLDEMACKKYL